jgi:hypothetical protein
MDHRNVWVLHISHHHGDNFWVFTSEESARRRVEQWAREWWEKETGEALPGLTGEDLVEGYFAKVSDHESYVIAEAGLDEF